LPQLSQTSTVLRANSLSSVRVICVSLTKPAGEMSRCFSCAPNPPGTEQADETLFLGVELGIPGSDDP
jgi:hypothetical protein